MGLTSIFVCPEFGFWDALGCRNIIPDRMQSGVTKLLKMGMCNLNTCVAKHPKVPQINFVSKSFEKFLTASTPTFAAFFR